MVQLKLRGIKDPKVDTLALVTEWLNIEKPRSSWHMIMDNLDDIGVLRDVQASSTAQHRRGHSRSFTITQAPVREKLDEYLPQENRGTMLVTSRNRSAALKMTKVNQRVIRVPQMSDVEAFQLLQAKLPKGMTDDSILQLSNWYACWIICLLLLYKLRRTLEIEKI